MAMPVLVREEAVTVASVARECVAACPGNWERALAAFRKRINADAALYRELTEPLLEGALWAAIRAAGREERAIVWGQRPDRALSDDGIADAALAVRTRLMEMSLPGGRALGDATRVDIREHVEFYEGQAKGNAIKARWLRLIADRLPNDQKKVRDVLTERVLSTLQKKAAK